MRNRKHNFLICFRLKVCRSIPLRLDNPASDLFLNSIGKLYFWNLTLDENLSKIVCGYARPWGQCASNIQTGGLSLHSQPLTENNRKTWYFKLLFLCAATHFLYSVCLPSLAFPKEVSPPNSRLPALGYLLTLHMISIEGGRKVPFRASRALVHSEIGPVGCGGFAKITLQRRPNVFQSCTILTPLLRTAQCLAFQHSGRVVCGGLASRPCRWRCNTLHFMCSLSCNGVKQLRETCIFDNASPISHYNLLSTDSESIRASR